MTDDVLQLVLDRLDRMDADRESARREAKEERAEIISEIREVRDQVKVQNGRVGRLELWRAGLDAVAHTRSWRWPAVIGAASAIVAGTAVAVITALIQAT